MLLGDLGEGDQAPDYPVHGVVVNVVQSPHLANSKIEDAKRFGDKKQM